MLQVIVDKAGGDGADEVIVSGDVDNEEERERPSDEGPAKGGEDDVDWNWGERQATTKAKRHVRKDTQPQETRRTARPTKYGPAAPVNLSARRSTDLKQRKTRRAHDHDRDMAASCCSCAALRHWHFVRSRPARQRALNQPFSDFLL